MGRIFYQQIDALTLPGDATADIWSLMASASNKVLLHGWELTSNQTAAQLCQLDLHRISAAGTGGSAAGTEEKADEDGGAPTGVVRTLDTTPGTPSGPLMAYQWEQLGPVGHVYTPEMRILTELSEGIALGVETAVSSVVSGWICWEEF